ncbi:MAG TPA: hypothetical protein VL547_01180 [Dinghuibacter sp.]|jgi:hypothetical protein|uniref:hypothetical protein n=1 Tax=Dinghuibacter sp. TaxID=2024697 RepID=UPI002B81A4A7|nr:hypothetical protein [Dinghuibacter sp.]HTJ10600.1 hypothetical protein [Dinghuibacter sp.]
MKKPSYYSIVKTAIEEDSLPSIRSIQDIIPITVLTQDMRINYNTLSKRLLDPAQFTMEDINRLSRLIGVDSTMLFRKIEREVRR